MPLQAGSESAPTASLESNLREIPSRITGEYLRAQLHVLHWAVAVQELKRREREEQREMREQMREEEKARKEYERALILPAKATGKWPA